MERVNVAVIGCGFIAETAHIPNLLSIPRAKLVALCDVNQKRLGVMGAKFNINNIYTDFQKLLESPNVDVVIVCTPTPTHAQIATAAAAMGKHVFVEKPLAMTCSEADMVIQAAEKSGVRLMVGYQSRYLPNHRKVKAMMRKGNLGDILYAEAHSETLIIKPTEGILLDYGTHLIDLLRWYFDDTYVEKVGALLHTTDQKSAADTEATLILKFANGIITHIGVFWLSNYTNWEAADRYVKILGTKGKVITDFTGPTITLYKEGSWISRVRGPHKIMPRFAVNPNVPLTQTGYRKELEHFLDCVLNKEEPSPTGQEDKVNLKIVEAALKSSTNGKFIEVKPE